MLAAVVAGLVLLGTLVAVGASTPAAANLWRPDEGAKFNVPRSSGDTMLRLERQVIGAVRHARKGSEIRIAVFSFDRFQVARALIDAKRRGVSVQVLANDHETTRAERLLRRRLGHDRSRKNWFYECKDGCRSSGENLHDKFYLFSHTGGARNTVMTGSINMKLNGHKNQYNDLWTANDREKLYNGFNDLFLRLKRDRIDKPTHWVQTIGSFRLEAMPFPQYTRKTDPIMRILRKVKCFGAAGSTGSNGRTAIRVMMHAWGEDRGAYIARRLRNLYGNGCDVRLLYGFSGAMVRRELSRPSRRGRVPIRSTGYDTNLDGELDLYTHQKNMTISGNYGADRSTNLVVTGSSNWTVDGMRGDEEIFVIDGKGGLPRYRGYFKWLWSRRSHSVSWSPTAGSNWSPRPTRLAARIAPNVDLGELMEDFEPGLDGVVD